MSSSPTKLSVQRLEDQGYLIQVAEHRPKHTSITRDLFGFIDILAVHGPGKEFLGVQTTSEHNLEARRRKILDDRELRDRAKTWIQAGGTIEIHGWREDGSVRVHYLKPWELEGETLDEKIARMQVRPKGASSG